MKPSFRMLVLSVLRHLLSQEADRSARTVVDHGRARGELLRQLDDAIEQERRESE